MKHRRNIFVFTLVPVWALLLSLTFYLNKSSLSAAPATFTVTNTNDSGAGSLRQAIEDTNSNGNPSDMDIIEFDIPGSQVHTINLQSDLPSVTEKLTIDGYTQEGAQENTAISPNPINSIIKIELAGTSATITSGILGLVADDSITRGLSIYDGGLPDNNFGKIMMGLAGNNTKLQGSYIGVKADGITPGVFDRNCLSVGVGGSNAEIGGDSPSDRNILFSSCSTANSAALGSGGLGTKIFGNYIGIAKDGETDLTPVAVDANGFDPPFSIGVNIVNTGSVTVGGPTVGESNLGINLSAFLDTNADFIPNEFTNRGPTPNDVGDGDTGPNGYINFPVLKTAQQVGNQLTITYDLDATDSPSDRYRVEFYANNERSIFGYGPGETYLGAATSVEPGNNKTATITVNGDFTGKALSATTTAIDDTTDSGFGSTSEFAQNISIGSVEDFDADGIPSSVEDAAPNNGDGNNDGIPDKDQPTVSSYPDYDNSNYFTLITDGCSENGTVSSLGPNALQTQDSGYSYPHGLTNFTLYCSRGDTVNLTMYIHGDTTTPEQYIPRKYNPTTNQFSDVPGSNVTTETLGASTATKLTYAATDGGDLDDDGEENGIIVDPVGLATEQNGVLANTGDLIILAIPIGLSLLLGAFIVTYRDYRKHKKPLKEADPFAASTYTYWHHLKVVTIPLASYRLSVTFERKQKVNSSLIPG